MVYPHVYDVAFLVNAVVVEDFELGLAAPAWSSAGAARLSGILYGESGGLVQNVTVSSIKTAGYADRTYGIDLSAAAELAEVGAEHAQCRTCQCYRRPAEEALSILGRASPDEPIASYLRKILASPGLEHG